MTEREYKIVRFVVLGYTNKEICREMRVTKNTLYNELSQIYKKYGYADRESLRLDLKNRIRENK